MADFKQFEGARKVGKPPAREPGKETTAFAALVFAASPLCALEFKLLKLPSYVDYVRQRLGLMDAVLELWSVTLYIFF